MKSGNEKAFNAQVVDGIPLVSPTDVLNRGERVRIVDVRRPEEFYGELGHIQSAELVTLGPDLTRFLERGDRSAEIVFVCRSGVRSGQATLESQRLGYARTVNMTGGMLLWGEMKLPTVR